MRIELIPKEQYDTIIDIYNKYPKLTYMNRDYDGIDISALGEEEQTAHKEVSTILRAHIKGFSRFNHFRNINGRAQIRLQYNYNWDEGITFIGVGYLFVDELLNGFDKPKEN